MYRNGLTFFLFVAFLRSIVYWKKGFQKYGDAGNYGILKNEQYFPLLYSNGAEVRDNIKGRSIPTPTSMRGVDSESVVGIIKNI